MSYYIFIFLCCVQLFITVTAYPKYISTSANSKQLANKFVKYNYSLAELQDRNPTPGQFLKSFQQFPSLESHILELEGLRHDVNKEQPPANIVETEKDKGVDDVVEEIRNHRFTQAEIILQKMDAIDKIPEIVHNVYNSSDSNIDLLLDFGHDLTKTDLAGSILFALWDEMKANKHNDVHKMIALVNTIDLKLIKLSELPEWKEKAEFVTDEVILDITSASIEILKAAMISTSYRNNTQVKLLANSIFELDLDHKVFDEVIHKVVVEIFPQVSAVELAENLYSHAFLSQSISGLQELFKRLEQLNNLDNPAVLNIAEYLKNFKDMSNYVNLSESKKEAVDMMIKKMPMCARNLFFEPFVCIWNKGKAEYLYLASSEFNRNEDKRSVFTRTTGEAVGPGVWIVEKSGDEFFFRNKAYENEYLFAASGMYNKDSRFVHTSIEGGKVGNKSSWQIELEANICYIRNVHYDEYLIASDRQSGDKSRYAFTWTPKPSTKEANFQWQIRSCDLSEILKKGL